MELFLGAALPLYEHFNAADIETALVSAGFALMQDRLGTVAACSIIASGLLATTSNAMLLQNALARRDRGPRDVPGRAGRRQRRSGRRGGPRDLGLS